MVQLILNYGKHLCSFIALCIFLSLPFQAQGAVDQAELREALQKIFAEHPELVLDVLRNNSETVLEVAQQGDMQRKRKALKAKWAQDAKIPKKFNMENAFVRGPQNAPVTIVAFSDFTCGFCRQADIVVNQLMEKYQGKVRVVFKPLPKEGFGLSVAAAKYVLAAFLQDQRKAWVLYDAIFAEAEKLERDGEDFLKAAAVKAGLNMKQLMADYNGKKVNALLAADRDEANALDIQGTPYFFVNNLVIRGAVPKDLFEEAVEMALSYK